VHGFRMRIVTWNCCRGPLAAKAQRLAPFEADIAVLQECAQPVEESDRCVWFGSNPQQGLAVIARDPYRVRALPRLPGIARFVIPVEITGPHRFTLLAVWMKGGQRLPYVRGLIAAVRRYAALIARGPTVVVGDFNSNSMWDAEHPPDRNHTALVARLAEAGLVSAYHTFFDEPCGRETRPTYYFQWKHERPYHIDYCFVPERWARGPGFRVEIAPYLGWERLSDHRPVVVDVELTN
jgi:endonuclease/exonuclease/phosphatase family metal-dependent hydrolase